MPYYNRDPTRVHNFDMRVIISFNITCHHSGRLRIPVSGFRLGNMERLWCGYEAFRAHEEGTTTKSKNCTRVVLLIRVAA